MSIFYGSATGIGSMPHDNPIRALKIIKETLPFGPHWPQLPDRGRQEGFLGQHLSSLISMGLIDPQKGETPFFSDLEKDWPEKAARFYENYFACLDPKKNDDKFPFLPFPRENASGFYKFLKEKWESLSGKPSYLKGQLAGPLSFGLQINAGDGKAAFYREDLRDILNKALALIARFQVRSLKKFSIPVVIFIDEPLLLAYGQSPYISLSREHILQSLGEIVEAIRGEGAYVGVHCCSGGDWSLLFQLPVHIVSFDAYNYLDSMLVYSEELNSFLKKGGCLAWGLIPTSDAIENENAVSLEKKFTNSIERFSRHGVSSKLLLGQYLLTPSCGTGTLTVSQSEKVYRTTFQLQKMLALTD
ncbi:MAG: methionine synthase [Firmicutes bacterium]|nr:methionine synthase [Bacillota bacterium]